jgi:hypothetical protein
LDIFKGYTLDGGNRRFNAGYDKIVTLRPDTRKCGG